MKRKISIWLGLAGGISVVYWLRKMAREDMDTSRFHPIFLLRSVRLLLSGRARFPRERVGTTLTKQDGQTYTIFREMVLEPKPDQPEEPGGIFRVWFQTKMSPPQTIKLSCLTILGFLGLPGFRSKLWLLNEETGEFGGIYEWDTMQDAHNYDRSYAIKFSKWRSIPGQFKTEVFPQSDPRAEVHRPELVLGFARRGQ